MAQGTDLSSHLTLKLSGSQLTSTFLKGFPFLASRTIPPLVSPSTCPFLSVLCWFTRQALKLPAAIASLCSLQGDYTQPHGDTCWTTIARAQTSTQQPRLKPAREVPVSPGTSNAFPATSSTRSSRFSPDLSLSLRPEAWSSPMAASFLPVLLTHEMQNTPKIGPLSPSPGPDHRHL